MAKKSKATQSKSDQTRKGYEHHRDRMGAVQREQSENSRDIGKLPPVKNKRRRQRCERDLPLFLKTYFPHTFYLDYSPDQLSFLGDVQNVIIKGGRKAVGMSRGGGKTQSLSRAAGCWAPSYGHRNFLALIGSEKEHAKELSQIIQIEWETNPLLLEDFPEIAYPIRCLEGINQRANGQLCEGERTHITWTDNELIFPAIKGAKSAGTVIRCVGILGRIRGMARVNAATGATDRPDCFLVDDFQTDASARSDVQCSTRELILNGAIAGLGGPGKTVAGLATSTIIRHGDTASRLFNRTLYPRWRASVFKLVYKWPTGKKAAALWDQYLEIRAAELEQGIEEHPNATAFYKKHRKAMDRGSKVAWEKRHFPHEISALQHAYGLRADNPATFDAEYQNDPRREDQHIEGLRLPTSDELVKKCGQYKRGVVPNEATHLFAGIDVQGNSLWWTVTAIRESDFSGWVVDRGVWPSQHALGPYFTLSQITEATLQSVTQAPNDEQALLAGLAAVAKQLFGRKWRKADGEKVHLNSALIDARHQTKVVHSFCRTTSFPILPSLGIGVTAKNVPWEATKRKKGERRGYGWKMPPVGGTSQCRHVNIDTNTWQTMLTRRWTSGIGDEGSWHLWRSAHQLLRMIADHLTSESCTETEGRGRKLYEWFLKPGCENHWLDTTRLCGVAASVAGIAVPGEVRKVASGSGATSMSKKSKSIKAPKKKPHKIMQQRREEAKAAKRRGAGRDRGRAAS